MPIYEYDCRACGHSFEVLTAAGGKGTRCPLCRSAKLKRRFSVFAAHQGAGAAAAACAERGCPAAAGRGGPSSPCAAGRCPLSS
jgi:putative FmdB family regulatory protein